MAADAGETTIDASHMDILSVAAECFEKSGFSATSIDDVARKLGATKGRIYHHFPSKTDLFVAVVRRGMAMCYEAIEPVRQLDLPPLQKLSRMAAAHAKLMIETKHFQRSVWEGVEMHRRAAMTPDQRDALEELLRTREGYSALFRRELVAARDNGDLVFENLSVTNQLMFMALNSPIFWYSPRPGETQADINRLVGQIVQFTLRGLGASKEFTG